MPMDGVMLGFVTRELRAALLDGRVDRIIQPERDEIHILLRAGGENHRLLLSASANAARVHLTRSAKTGPMEAPMFCMLLRKHLLGARLQEILQVGGDRVLELRFLARNEMGDPVERRLIAEMMGRHSNIILVGHDGRVIDSIRHVSEDLSRVRQVQPGLAYQSAPSQGKLDPTEGTAEAFALRLAGEGTSCEKAILRCLSGFSPQAAREAACRCGFAPEEQLSPERASLLAARLRAYIDSLATLASPVITLHPDGMPADVFPFPQTHLAGMELSRYDSPSDALEAYFGERDRREHMKQRASTLQHLIHSHIERCEKKIAIQDEALAGAARMDEYRRNGELLQASLYLLEKGSEWAEVQDYYSEGCPLIRIRMDTALSPAENAQRYFKLYRKARGARALAAEQKAKAEEELLFLLQAEDDLRKAASEQDLSELRALLEEAGYLRRQAAGRIKQRKNAPAQPMRYASSDGTVIEVGKNAWQNERMTLAARGDEYWLHVQKMPGSHVVVHSDAPTERTLAEAALLAAFYSKGGRSAQVPVDITQRRYIKKPGGTPPGFVVYTHQRTVFVTPSEGDVSRLRLIRP